jgi:hypothetical protein
MTAVNLQKVDLSAIKANQLTIILLKVPAFIFNLAVVTAFVAEFLGGVGCKYSNGISQLQDNIL